ncbi:MAG: glycosyltransferase [Candidatus Coatesbacteria bacterium]|nr:glycosyltransferase [Candidatus Coatesbacteria bacterium]
MKFRLLLPSFNEAENLAILIPSCISVLEKAPFEYDITVVDDGSTDETASIMSNCSKDRTVNLIRHSRNMGLGSALFTGFKELAPECDDGDLICTLDADNTHPPQLFLPLTSKLSEGFDVVIASRFESGGEVIGLSLYRRMLSRAAAVVLSTVYPAVGVRDYTSGFRAYRASCIREALDTFGDHFITRADFSCNAEILIKILSIGAKAAEIPLSLRYDRKHGSSKLRLVRTSMGYLALLKSLRRLKRR